MLDLDAVARDCFEKSRAAERLAAASQSLSWGGAAQLSIALTELAMRLQALPLERSKEVEHDARLIDLVAQLDQTLGPEHSEHASKSAMFHHRHHEHMSLNVSSQGKSMWAGRMSWFQAKIQSTPVAPAPYCKSLTPDVLLQLVKDYLKLLGGDEAIDEDDEDAFVRVGKHQAPPKHPGPVNGLVYRNLAANTACSCKKSHGAHVAHHTSTMQLDPYMKPLPDDRFRFSMLFSVFAHAAAAAPFGWQSAQVIASSKSVDASKGLRFQLPGELLPSLPWQNSDSKEEDRELTVQPGEFCNFLRSDKGDCLSFEVLGADKLHYLDVSPEHAPPDWLRAVPGTAPGTIYHLGEIIETRRMPFRTRPVLAFSIAKAVWMFYNSEWMTNVWTHFDIQFLEQYPQVGQPRVECRPFFFVKFEDTEVGSIELRRGKAEGSHERTHKGTLWHRYPIVFSLGVILLEIATGACIVETKPQSWDTAAMNKLFLKCQGLLKTARMEDDCKDERFQMALKSCFDKNLFEDCPFRAADPKKELKSRLEILYDKVVYPLWRLLEDAGWSESIDEIENTHLEHKENLTSPQKQIAHSHPLQNNVPWKKPKDVQEFTSMFDPAKLKAGPKP